MSQIVRNFSATFCATSATSLTQLLDFLSATFWGTNLGHVKPFHDDDDDDDDVFEC